MKPRQVFAVSLCLNLALAGTAVWLLKKSASPMSGVVAVTDSRSMPAAPAPSSTAAPSNSPAPVAYVANRFAWSRIEAEDFEELALNLRAIGCPEKTVRDIVIARGGRTLEQVSREFEPKLSFWTAGLRRARARQESERQARLAQEQIMARLERAIGQGVFLGVRQMREMMAGFEGQAILRFMFGPMPEETFFKVAARLTWYDERREEIGSRTQGVWLDEDEAELAQLRTRYQRELAALLPPAQLEEMTARMAMLPLMDRVKFEATDLSAAEVRQLSLIRARFSDPLTGPDSIFGRGAWTDEQEQELKAAERQFLGAARFAQLERAADSDFKTLFSLGQDLNLPREAAVKVFDLRQLSAQEVEHLRQDKSLTDADRKARLDQMQAEVQQAVAQLLGANASGQYLGRGGAWLTNLNGLTWNAD